MGIALIFGLITAVIALLWLAITQNNTIKHYEAAMTQQVKRRKNVTKSK